MTRGPKAGYGSIQIDRSGRAPGRGAYLCPSLDCLGEADRKRRFERAFRAKVVPELERLRAEIENFDR